MPEAHSTRVRIVGDHPHRGAAGTVREDEPKVQGMSFVALDEGSAVYAARRNLRALTSEEDPRA